VDFAHPKIAKCFQIKKNVTAKYKFDIHSKEEKKKMSLVKKLSKEETILLNKDKLLVCVDTGEEDKTQVQYCFVSRQNVVFI